MVRTRTTTTDGTAIPHSWRWFGILALSSFLKGEKNKTKAGATAINNMSYSTRGGGKNMGTNGENETVGVNGSTTGLFGLGSTTICVHIWIFFASKWWCRGCFHSS